MFSGGKKRCLLCLFLISVVLTVLIIVYTPGHSSRILLPKHGVSPVTKTNQADLEKEPATIRTDVTKGYHADLEEEPAGRAKRTTETEVPGWGINVSRETKRYIRPEYETSLISGKRICGSPGLNLLIVVHSAPGHLAQRQAIRDTWASPQSSSVRVAFLLGRTTSPTLQRVIEKESNDHQDVIQEDFIDSYNNLTIKAVMLLKWYLGRCAGPRFLMKSDDDMYIAVPKLEEFLGTVRPASNLLVGTLFRGATPYRNSDSKWYVPRYIYPKDSYPNFVRGAAYVMSRDVARKLYSAALSTPLIPTVEDAYITGICAAKAGVTPRDHPGFTPVDLGVRCLTSTFTNHGLTPSQMRQTWKLRHNCAYTGPIRMSDQLI